MEHGAARRSQGLTRMYRGTKPRFHDHYLVLDWDVSRIISISMSLGCLWGTMLSPQRPLWRLVVCICVCSRLPVAMRYDCALTFITSFLFLFLFCFVLWFFSVGAVPVRRSILHGISVRLDKYDEQDKQVQPIHPEVESVRSPEPAACRGGNDGGNRRVASGGESFSGLCFCDVCGSGGGRSFAALGFWSFVIVNVCLRFVSGDVRAV